MKITLVLSSFLLVSWLAATRAPENPTNDNSNEGATVDTPYDAVICANASGYSVTIRAIWDGDSWENANGNISLNTPIDFENTYLLKVTKGEQHSPVIVGGASGEKVTVCFGATTSGNSPAIIFSGRWVWVGDEGLILEHSNGVQLIGMKIHIKDKDGLVVHHGHCFENVHDGVAVHDPNDSGKVHVFPIVAGITSCACYEVLGSKNSLPHIDEPSDKALFIQNNNSELKPYIPTIAEVSAAGTLGTAIVQQVESFPWP